MDPEVQQAIKSLQFRVEALESIQAGAVGNSDRSSPLIGRNPQLPQWDDGSHDHEWISRKSVISLGDGHYQELRTDPATGTKRVYKWESSIGMW